jgi:formate C-acetyltransferase
MKCGKFGQNSQADLYAVNVAEILQKVIRHKSHDNIYFCPSLHTLHSNVSAGNSWGAGFDGRSAQTPFAKNAGPSNDARDKVPTSMLLSSAKLPHSKFFGGQPIDINFGADTVKNHKKEIAALIKLYFQKGGLQLQVNSLSSKILKDAIAKPQNYTDLVVRVGGFSTYFNNLSLQAKQEFVERVEKEEG